MHEAELRLENDALRGEIQQYRADKKALLAELDQERDARRDAQIENEQQQVRFKSELQTARSKAWTRVTELDAENNRLHQENEILKGGELMI